MPWTEADLLTIRAARLRGEKTVQYRDRSVTYKSDAELKQVEDEITTELNATSSPTRRKQFFGVASKGF